MAASNLYRVTYHFEVGGKRISDTFQDNIIASASDYNSLASVLSSNSKTNNGKGTLVISGQGHISASGILS